MFDTLKIVKGTKKNTKCTRKSRGGRRSTVQPQSVIKKKTNARWYIIHGFSFQLHNRLTFSRMHAGIALSSIVVDLRQKSKKRKRKKKHKSSWGFRAGQAQRSWSSSRTCTALSTPYWIVVFIVLGTKWSRDIELVESVRPGQRDTVAFFVWKSCPNSDATIVASCGKHIGIVCCVIPSDASEVPAMDFGPDQV